MIHQVSKQFHYSQPPFPAFAQPAAFGQDVTAEALSLNSLAVGELVEQSDNTAKYQKSARSQNKDGNWREEVYGNRQTKPGSGTKDLTDGADDQQSQGKTNTHTDTVQSRFEQRCFCLRTSQHGQE